MKTRSAYGTKEFTPTTDRNINNSKDSARNANYRKTMVGMAAESKIEYLGKFFAGYSTGGRTLVGLTDITIKNIGSNPNQALLKLNALLEIMNYNAEFMTQAISEDTLISSNTLKSTSGILNLSKHPKPAYQVNYVRAAEISNLSYEGFVSTLLQELTYSDKTNPTYTSNDKILWSLLKQVASQRSVSKEEFSQLAGRVKEVLNKNQNLYKLIANDKEILRNLYNKCNKKQKEDTSSLTQTL